MRARLRQPEHLQRRGTLLPAIAVGLLVAGGAVALVLDQLWLSTAHRELQTAANAAVLAAGQALANEDLLRSESAYSNRGDHVREVASHAALLNRAAGGSVVVSLEPGRDIRLGRPIVDSLTGQTTFIETDVRPSTVIVAAHRDRASGNPVSLFMPYLTGQPYGDAVARAEASIDNHIIAVRPLDHANVPAWPIAILESNGVEQDDWGTTIENRVGTDRLGWDPVQHLVTDQPDGLTEIVLRSGSLQQPGNVLLIDLGTGLEDAPLKKQLQAGWSWRELQEFGSRFSFEQGPQQLIGSHDFQGMPIQELKNQIGQSRIVLLFDEQQGDQSTRLTTINTTRFVGIRLLQVSETGTGIELVVQPTVIATRTAILSDANSGIPPNPYLYRIAITQ